VPAVDPLRASISGASYVWQPSPVAVLADLRAHARYGSLSSSTYLFVTDAKVEKLGPAQYGLNLMGFEQISEQLWFPPAADQLQELRMELTPSSDCMGLVRLTVAWPTLHGGFGSALIGDLGFIRISQTGADQIEHASAPMVIRVRSALQSDWDIELPCGSYEARFLSRLSGLSFPAGGEPPLLLTVGPNRRAEAQFDLRSTGGLRIGLADSVGINLSGAFSASVLTGVAIPGLITTTSVVSFHEAPYLLGPFAPGQYSISPLGHSSLEIEASTRTFEIVAGEWSAVTLSAK
jgi:hypothetical protein